MFAGIVIFSIMGFKANVVYKECLVKQNDTLMGEFGTADVIVPENGLILWEGVNVSVPYCSLEKELDNVSTAHRTHP